MDVDIIALEEGSLSEARKLLVGWDHYNDQTLTDDDIGRRGI